MPEVIETGRERLLQREKIEKMKIIVNEKIAQPTKQVDLEAFNRLYMLEHLVILYRQTKILWPIWLICTFLITIKHVLEQFD